MKKRKTVVLVGCGSISNCWFESVKDFDDIEFVGLVDLNTENAEKYKEKYGLENALTGSDLQDILDKTQPDIVFDCTIPAAHHDVVVSALKHACHVMGEKPMAESMSDASEMVETAQACGKTYAVIQNRRYLKDIVRFRDLLASGKLGNLTTLNADFYIGAHFGGFRDEMEHVLLLDMAIHSFDQARFISGKDPVSVIAYEWNPPGSWYKHGASAVCVFEMSDGTVFNYRGSWCSEGMNTSWECQWRAICEKGSALWDGGENMSAEVLASDEGFSREMEKLELDSAEELEFSAHSGVIREFLDSLDGGGRPQTICTDNIKSLAMVHAAIESAETGKKVSIKY